MPSRCWSKGKGHFIKVPLSDKESEASGSCQDRGHGGASSQAAGHLTCNQTPAYIRGSGPLEEVTNILDPLSDGGSTLSAGHLTCNQTPACIRGSGPLEEVTDILDPLSDGGSSCSKSSDLGSMVEVMALGDEKGGDSPRPLRPPLECLLP
jgi:hypothetical protein